MSFSKMVADAMFADGDERTDIERQITCKMAASHNIMCECGNILDQSTVCVLEREWTDGRTSHVVTCCPSCRVPADAKLREILGRKTSDGQEIVEGTFSWLTWDSADAVKD